MASSRTQSVRPQRRSVLRLLVLCGLLAVPIIIGLLSMHTLNMHGSPAAMSAHSAMPAHAAVSAHPTAPMHLTGSEPIHPAHSSTPEPSDPEPNASAHHSPTSAMAHSAVAAGESDSTGMAMTCVLALLLVVLLLALPAVRPRWLHSPSPLQVTRRIRRAGAISPLPPSLTELCISRT